MKFVSIIGARPDFVQVGVLSKVLRRKHDEVTIHTGQHYDIGMSDVFFAELGLSQPEINLDIGSMDAASQVGAMTAAIARCLREIQPDAVIVRGDTSGTIAGAIAAKHELFPLVHIEAGCRSYDRTMPEEINRVAADHLADVLMTTDEQISENLRAEGVTNNVFVTGDVMFDTYEEAVKRLNDHQGSFQVPTGTYVLLTMHRSENVDDPMRLASIFRGFSDGPSPVLFPAHPRTRRRIAEFGLVPPESIALIEPLGYFDMIRAERGAATIFTDSGGVQREAYYGSIPCVTLRDNSEWMNTVHAGWNRLVGCEEDKIRGFLREPPAKPATHPPLFGDGHAAEKIVAIFDSEPFREIVEEAHRVRTARRRLTAPGSI